MAKKLITLILFSALIGLFSTCKRNQDSKKHFSPLPKGELGITLGISFDDLKKLNFDLTPLELTTTPNGKRYYECRSENFSERIKYLRFSFSEEDKRLKFFDIDYNNDKMNAFMSDAIISHYSEKYGEPKKTYDSMYYYEWSDDDVKLVITVSDPDFGEKILVSKYYSLIK